ncbi:MAG: TRAP transporter TatT component family protein [Planctomycetes bacterium]|nr:TRAP transporter TatT component family protein [Planctomycetota bacterium]
MSRNENVLRRHSTFSACALLLLLTVFGCGLSGCGLADRTVRRANLNVVENFFVAVRRSPDPELVRQGLPTILLLVDSFLVSSPDDPELLLVATKAYNSYCLGFVSEEFESARAIGLYERSREYGLRLLKQRAFFAGALDLSIEEYAAALQQFTKDDVPEIQAAAAAWLGWIIADTESMEALAELPKALALAERALELDESYGDGTNHIVFALFFVVQPRGAGQDLDRSKTHFERAIELAGPENLLPRVLYAEHFGKATLDEEFFVAQLESVLAVDAKDYPENRLLNELAQQQARRLLANREDIF